MSSYHQLTVKSVREETADAARSFVLEPEPTDRALFAYTPGQFLSFRVPHKDGEITRSYSLSSAPATDPDMMICVKRVDRGRGSNWFNDNLIAGARIEATPPSGRFVLRDGNAPLFLIAGGSGITPCISIIKQALVETSRPIKLVYANRDAASVIYQDTLDLLEKRFEARFTCQHWLDSERGFMTAHDVSEAIRDREQAEFYICGPGPLMDMAEDTLVEMLGDEATILTERFASPDDPASAALDGTIVPDSASLGAFRLTLEGEDYTVPIGGGETLLEAAVRAGVDAPSSCTEGHCGSCMCQLKEGDVTMASTKALSKRNIAKGYVLACQARPSSDAPIWLDFDL